jgi:hypothetical protein
MARYRVTITGRGYDAMADLVRKHEVSINRGTARSKDDEYRVDAIVDETTIPELEKLGYQVERHEDVDQLGRERQSEVGRGNRYRT